MKVSVCVVAYNEEKYLPELLQDIQKQTYPLNLIEVVLVNSMSTDGTRVLMEDFAREQTDFLGVKVLDNPKKAQAPGWNTAISAAAGDVIVRIDAHSRMPVDFVQKKMENIFRGEKISGGVCYPISESESPWQNTMLQVENSLFGSSVNPCRRSKKKIYVKTMSHAAYAREVFEAVGGFNENLLRTEDNDLHQRMRSAGFRLYFDPEIVSYQYARSNFRRMLKQKYGNGLWIGLTLGVNPKCVSLFHLVPCCFVMAILATTILSAWGLWHLGALMWILYGLFALSNTVISIVNDGFHVTKLLMPALFLALHVAYGLGTTVGLVKMPFVREKLSHCPEIQKVKEAVAGNK